jgi:hypothetical protein
VAEQVKLALKAIGLEERKAVDLRNGALREGRASAQPPSTGLRLRTEPVEVTGPSTGLRTGFETARKHCASSARTEVALRDASGQALRASSGRTGEVPWMARDEEQEEDEDDED